MIVDGKAIAERIFSALRQEVKDKNVKPTLGVVYVGDNPVIDNFVSIKKRKGEEIGVQVEILKFDPNIKESDLIAAIKNEAKSGKYSGLIVQLPLPPQFDPQMVLNAVPQNLDVDVLAQETLKTYVEGEIHFIPPVAGAVEEVLTFHNIDLVDKKIVLIGKGRLVGNPVHFWLQKKGISHEVIDEYADISAYIPNADVIISGAGVPGLITPEIIKEGVVLIDAGTSEQGGRIVGDVDSRCEGKASFFTPVPGGIGPITAAMLFRNIVRAVSARPLL